MPPPQEPPTFRMFVTAFTDFLAVAIHTILYERQIYPATAFISAKKYNFPVRQNRHPQVCEWINDAVNAVEAELFKGSVERVAVVIYSKQAKPLERVVFDVSRFPVVPSAQFDVPLERVEADGSQAVILPRVDLEEQLRATMSRLSNCGSTLKTLPPGCSFTVAIELKAASAAPLKHPQPWVPAERQSPSYDEASDAHTHTVPVRSVAAGEMVFETWLEELEDQSPAGLSDSF
ncbi:uncharacterized protein MYCFIDRAFT_43518 [Pseudocercospora fijiensis CIRAD86]|uniref:HORMA domain-containing protein n=1 Tax=Pseudocercospora fijiensis (strain CIRAD86) TaxID=383855 RepID=M2ZIE4_PSEFD|nr:uncharacterized protein MYCFIDRAFT_43518 [Pseudocercospora fijiensis CIRAD86]EME78884.1 hypothetical protein MYCFIDRAFT_43518 [Pseudocercospora fijiensis CIRAD86]